MEIKRCSWPGSDPLMVRYHDLEWGVPLYNDKKLFEFLVLDASQAGLSWSIILKKRENYRKAFSGFDPVRIARYTAKDIARLMNNPGIVRNRLKINSAILNAQAFLRVKKEFGSFNKYIWTFVGQQTVQNKFSASKDIPAKSAESDAMSRDMKKRGFTFVGSTICYAFMQAAGLVNDHIVSCYRHEAVKKMGK